MKTTASTIEAIEARIAPASLVTINAATKTATWTDVDGDLVTYKWTGAAAPTFSDHTPANAVAGGTLVDKITLHNGNDAITVTVKPGPLGGDGHVNLGYVNATGLPIKSFTAPHASVLEFDCGNALDAIGTFSIGSYGTLRSTAFVSPGGDGKGVFDGAVGSFKIAGDIDYGDIILGGASATLTVNKIGSVTIGGSLHGDVSQTADTAGELVFDGPAGAVKIAGSIISGQTIDGGKLLLKASATSITIGGDIVGGILGQDGDGKTVITVGGSVSGRTQGTGLIKAGVIKSLVIGGDLQGGRKDASGSVLIGSASSVTIKGSIIGGDVLNPIDTDTCGALEIFGDVGSITVGHNVVAGNTTHTDGQTNLVTKNGAILVQGTLGSLSIGGSIEGNNATRAFIVAEGTTPAKLGNFNGIGKLSVKGSVSYAVIASGQSISTDYTANMGVAENPDAGIGSVMIGGDYYHSSIMAGTNDNDKIGVGRHIGSPTTSDDTQSTGNASRHAILGPVTIKGALLDDADAAGYSGFEAEQIAKIIVGGVTVFAHNATPNHIQFFDPTHFILAQEISVT